MGEVYPLDRVSVPEFYTPKEEGGTHADDFGQVFAPSSEHHTPGWITLGYVSKQTPFGQGTYLGFPRSEIRKATREEVLVALEYDHPFGEDFRPNCQEALDAGFHLALSRVFGDWTTDDASERRSVLGMSRQQISDYGRSAAEKHRELLSRWGEVCEVQISAIEASLG